MTTLRSIDFIIAVCEALNVDYKTVRAVEINAVMGDPMVNVVITHYPEENFATFMKARLQKADENPPPNS